MIEKLKEGIYRICIPFENIYTTSFLLKENDDIIILDSGASNEDAERYIIPLLEDLEIRVRYLVSTHTHGDHHGGIEALRKRYPEAEVCLFSENEKNYHRLFDGELLLDRFKMLNLKGHCDDSLAVYDERTNTLISGDSLQCFGVGNYGTAVADINEYRKSIAKVRRIGADAIIASHEYVSIGYMAEGEMVDKYLDECESAVKEIERFAESHPDLSGREFLRVFNKEHLDLPPVNETIIGENFINRQS